MSFVVAGMGSRSGGAGVSATRVRGSPFDPRLRVGTFPAPTPDAQKVITRDRSQQNSFGMILFSARYAGRAQELLEVRVQGRAGGDAELVVQADDRGLLIAAQP